MILQRNSAHSQSFNTFGSELVELDFTNDSHDCSVYTIFPVPVK